MTTITQLKTFDKYLDDVREKRDLYQEMLSHIAIEAKVRTLT